LQDPPKFTQIGIFGLKIFHLATLKMCAVRFGGNSDEMKLGKKSERKVSADSDSFGEFAFKSKIELF
jgi:hypothetical protein